MKKTLAAILLLSMLLSIFPASVSADGINTPVSIIFDSSESLDYLIDGGGIPMMSVTFRPGDVNGDGVFNARDALVFRKQLSGIITPQSLHAYELCGDESVNAADYLQLRLILTGKRTRPATVTKRVPVPAISALEGGTSDCGITYDEAQNAAKIVSGGGEYSVKLDVAAYDANISADVYKYMVITYMTPRDNSESAVGGTVTPVAAGGDVAAKDFKFSSNGAYTVKVIDLADDASWSGNIVSFDMDIFSESEAGDVIYIDSCILTATIDDLEVSATDVLRERALTNPDDGYSDPTKKAYIFDSAEKCANITYTNSVTCSYSEGEKALQTKLVKTGDPHFYLDLENEDISADDYKYVVYVYKAPTSIKVAKPQAELFLCAGDTTEPTENHSVQMSLSLQDKYVYQLFDLSKSDFWQGKIHGVRFDILFSGSVGDTVCVDSIIFCDSFGSASEAATSAAVEANSGVRFTNGIEGVWDSFMNTATGVVTANEHIDRKLDGSPIYISGGNVDTVSKASFLTRLVTFVTRTTGDTINIQVIDGFDAVMAGYLDHDCGDEMLTLKLTGGSEMCIVYQRARYQMKKVIFDSDLGPDCDDAGAAAILVNAHNRGEIKLLALTHTLQAQYGAYCMAALCDYLGADDVVCTMNTECTTTYTGNNKDSEMPAKNYWNAHGGFPNLPSNVATLRAMLAENNQKDIFLISTGPVITFSDLLNSVPDEISPKTGRELIADNVYFYMFGGGRFDSENAGDNNIECAQDRAALIADTMPTLGVDMIFCGGEVGENVYSGGILANCSDDYVVKGCYYYQNRCTGNYARNSWDLCCVYYALYGGCGMWGLKENYKIWFVGGSTKKTAGAGTYGFIYNLDESEAGIYRMAGTVNGAMAPYLK